MSVANLRLVPQKICTAYPVQSMRCPLWGTTPHNNPSTPTPGSARLGPAEPRKSQRLSTSVSSSLEARQISYRAFAVQIFAPMVSFTYRKGKLRQQSISSCDERYKDACEGSSFTRILSLQLTWTFTKRGSEVSHSTFVSPFARDVDLHHRLLRLYNPQSASLDRLSVSSAG